MRANWRVVKPCQIPDRISLANFRETPSSDPWLQQYPLLLRKMAKERGGTAPLQRRCRELTGVSAVVDGADAASFTVAGPPVDTIPAGAAADWTVTFAPATPGNKTAALHFAGNGVNNIFEVTLAGKALSSLEVWKEFYFESSVNEGISANNADPDQDGARRNLYPGFIAFIRAAMDDLARQGCEPTLAGVFWHTGENDTWFDPYARKYAAWMKDLIAQVRLDLKAPALPWFISEQKPGTIWGKNIDAVNRDLRAMAQAGQHLYIISAAALPHERHHFGTKGTLLLGQEFANAWLKTR
jgi:hypothetical protein